MPALEVVFEVPHKIIAGLANGSLQRVGGVIVNSDSKQVVAWLRDSISNSDNPVSDASGVLANVLRGVQGTSAFNPAANLLALTAGGQIINLALTGITLHNVTQKLNDLTQKVEALSLLIRSEFSRNRELKFSMALAHAHEALESGQAARREYALNKAKDELLAAMQDYLDDFDRTIQVEEHESRIPFTQQYLLRAIYAQISRIQCYLLDKDDAYAKSLIRKDMPRFEKAVRQFVEGCLGVYPAVFFHKDVPFDDLKRFIAIQRWLAGDDVTTSADDAEILLYIMDKFRGDFWNPEVARYIEVNTNPVSDLFDRVRNQPKVTQEERLALMRQRLTQAESAIENFDRLRGFELELVSMRLGFEEWSRLVDESTLQEKGIGLIVDWDQIEQMQYQ